MSANPSVGFYMNKLFIKNGNKCIIVGQNLFVKHFISLIPTPDLDKNPLKSLQWSNLKQFSLLRRLALAKCRSFNLLSNLKFSFDSFGGTQQRIEV